MTASLVHLLKSFTGFTVFFFMIEICCVFFAFRCVRRQTPLLRYLTEALLILTLLLLAVSGA